MSEATWKGYVINALRISGYSADMIRKVIKNLEKSLVALPDEEAEALITEIIKAFCPKDKDGFYNGIILDPFHGSGTLGVCCEKLNKKGHHIRWIGIELEEKWCKIALERLSKIDDH